MNNEQLDRSDQAELAQFGYDQSLDRTTGRFASFAVAFAFVSIATGIFTTYGSVLNTSGPAGIWTWPFVVVGQTAVALVLGMLASRIPVTGYAYQWVSRVANPILGWVVGWVAVTFLVVVLVAVDYTIAATVMPVLLSYTSSLTTNVLVTATVVLIQACLAGSSTKWSERVNSAAVSAELIGMLILTVLLYVVAAFRGQTHTKNLFSTGAIPHHDYMSFGDLTHAGPWMLGFMLGAFTIVGFESAANLAEETHDPERVVPRAMWQAVLASGILGFLFIVAVTLAVQDPVALAKSSTPVADVIRHTLGGATSSVLLTLIVVAIFACGLVIMMSGVRLIWAMSRDERFPGWKHWKQVSPRFHTPLRATMLYTVIALCVLGTAAFSENVLLTLFGAATLLPACIYLASVLLFLIKRKSLPQHAKFDLGVWERPVAVTALVWLLFELLLFRDTSFKDAWMYVLIMMAIGAVYLAALLRHRGRSGMAMPDMHSIDAEFEGR